MIQMQEDSGFGALPRRRGSGSVLTHAITAALAAGLAVVLLLVFYSPASGGQGGSSPGSGAAPSSLNSSQENIVTQVKPGLVLINTTLQYNSEAAAGTGMVINADGLVLTNNHVIDGLHQDHRNRCRDGQDLPGDRRRL